MQMKTKRMEEDESRKIRSSRIGKDRRMRNDRASRKNKNQRKEVR